MLTARRIIPTCRGIVHCRHMATGRTSVDEPSMSRPSPPPARTAPSQSPSPAGEEVSLGSSGLLLDTSEKVSPHHERLGLTAGAGHPWPYIYGWSWSPWTDRQGTANSKTQSVPSDPGWIRHCARIKPESCRIWRRRQLRWGLSLYNGINGRIWQEESFQHAFDGARYRGLWNRIGKHWRLCHRRDSIWRLCM